MILSAVPSRTTTIRIRTGWGDGFRGCVVRRLLSVNEAGAQISTNAAEKTVTIDSAPDRMSSRSAIVIVKRRKECLTSARDIIVEGRVEGELSRSAVGHAKRKCVYRRSVSDRRKYKPENAEPLRTEGTQTVMFAVYEEELKA